VRWGEVKARDYFFINNTNSFNKDVLTDGTDYDYITRTSLNRGIHSVSGFVNENNINSINTYSLGLLQMDFFYREKPWYAGQFIRKIVPKFIANKKVMLYFEVAFNKLKGKLLSVLVRDVDDIFSNSDLYLPLTDNNTPDFEYMEHYIRKLEWERLEQVKREMEERLCAYLNVAKLENYELTAEDKEVLAREIVWGEFKIGKLFKIDTSKKKFNANTIKFNGKYPYVARGENNNGIRGYIDADEKYLNNKNTISFGQDTATIFLQNESYFTGDKIKIMTPKYDFDKHTTHYIITAMRKAFFLFTWGSGYNVDKLNNVKIKLPTIPFGGVLTMYTCTSTCTQLKPCSCSACGDTQTPDYDYMAAYIRVQQKLTIADIAAKIILENAALMQIISYPYVIASPPAGNNNKLTLVQPLIL